MRALIAGGPNFNDEFGFNRALDFVDHIWPFTLVVAGGQPNIDALTRTWAAKKNIPVIAPAHNAPVEIMPLLNADRPDVAIVFPDSNLPVGNMTMAITPGSHVRLYCVYNQGSGITIIDNQGAQHELN